MSDSGGALLAPASSTLAPLPPVLRQGLAAVAVLGCLSITTTTALFCHLTYRLVLWHVRARSAVRQGGVDPNASSVDLHLGLAEHHFGRHARPVLNGQPQPAAAASRRPAERARHPNQFLLLVYNLFLADMHQAAAFLLNAVWVANDGIFVGTPTCFAQGWLVSTGDLASSCFSTLIAVHTYLCLVRGHKPPQRALYAAITGLWVFVYAMAVIGVAATRNGRDAGGYYVLATSWCWVSVSYENYRLVTHYLFIFISLGVTSLAYTLVFLALRSRGRDTASTTSTASTAQLKQRANFSGRSAPDHVHNGSDIPLEHLRSNSNTFKFDEAAGAAGAAGATSMDAEYHQQHPGGSHPGFLLYPLIYVICTLPLALGRIATMAGGTVPLAYFCAAGALITSNGWLDAMLWGLTRHHLIFSADVDSEDVGINTFGFVRTPPGRQFGNMVWVEGASERQRDEREERESTGAGAGAGAGRAVAGVKQGPGMTTPWRHGWQRLGKGQRPPGTRSVSQESLRGAAARQGGGSERGDMTIQLDTVTTVVVEVEGDSDGDLVMNPFASKGTGDHQV